MYSSTEAAYDAAEREWDAMTEDERGDAEAAADDDDAAYYAAQMAQAERVYATAIAAEERRTAAWVADDEAAIAAIEGGNGITIYNGNLTTVASMAVCVAQMEAFNVAGQSVGVTPFANTADLLDACRIIATLSAWQVVGEVSP